MGLEICERDLHGVRDRGTIIPPRGIDARSEKILSVM